MASRRYKAQDLTGKTALVTGATAGIGEQIAYRFAELNVKLVLVGRREDRLVALKAELLKIYAETSAGAAFGDAAVRTVTLDINNREGCEKMAAEIGAVDVLVNNAGLALGLGPADKADYNDTLQMFQTNVIATAHITQLFGAKMREQNSGHVVFISSVAATDCYDGGAGYCATKGAVHQYANSFRADVANTPIRVTTISPGAVDTDFNIIRFKGDAEKAANVTKDIVPLHADDVADQVIYTVTRPKHVQVVDLKCYCTNQAHAKWCVHRVGEGLGA